MRYIKKLKKIFGIVLIFYIGFGLLLFFAQKSLLYHPPAGQVFKDCAILDNYERVTHGGTRMYFKEASSDKVIVYYHGNGESACGGGYVKSYFESTGATIVFVEYAGYSGDTEHTPSQELILQDVEHTIDFIQSKGFRDVIVYGQSIGSGAASYHAYQGQVDTLVLVTPFSSTLDVAQARYRIYPAQLLLRERYDNMKWLTGYTGEVYILHGDSDFVISHGFSQKLFDTLTTTSKEYILLEGFGHNNIWESKEFQANLREIMSGI